MGFAIRPSPMFWKDVVRELIEADMGIRIAHVGEDGAATTNPRSNAPVTIHRLFVVYHEERPLTTAEVEVALAE